MSISFQDMHVYYIPKLKDFISLLHLAILADKYERKDNRELLMCITILLHHSWQFLKVIIRLWSCCTNFLFELSALLFY